MKLSEIRKMSQQFHFPPDSDAQLRFLEQANAMGLDYSNFYQKLEMDSPYVDTHTDVTYSNTQLQMHSHTFYELICCRNTCGAEYLVGAQRYKLQHGDIVLVPPDVSHRPILPEHMPEPYIRDVLWLSPEFINRLMDMFPDFTADLQTHSLLRTSGTRWEYLEELFHNGVREAEATAPGHEMAIMANSVTLLTHLLRARKDINAKPLHAEKPELLDQVLRYIEQHLSDKITLADVAHHFFISESTITQTFRKKMGVSFYRCVTQRRLIAAKALIERGLSLESVSEQVGFSDYSSFFRAFKQEFGISPRQYRKMQTENK